MDKDMRFVAFLRNVNLGQPKSPTRSQLESAFLQAGADSAVSFQTNGTLIFPAADRHEAQRIADRACAALREACGMSQPAFVARFDHLLELVLEDPFTRFEDPTTTGRAISFFAPVPSAAVQAPLESARKDCLIFQIDAAAGLALSVLRQVNGKTGYPTPVLEKALNAPVTTRGWNTILRMVKKHGEGD